MNIRKLKRKKTKIISSQKNQLHQLISQAADHYHSGRFQQALVNYQKALTLDPRNDEICNNIGSLFHSLGNIEKASFYYEKAITSNPKNISAIYNLGNIQLVNEDKTLAKSYFERVIAIDPNHASSLNNLGSLCNEAGEFDDALAYCKQAVLSVPEDALFHYNLGVMYHDAGDIMNANNCYKKALQINPRLANVHSTIVMSTNYDLTATPEKHYDLASNWWKMHGKPIANKFTFNNKNHDPEKILKIGFISPDFKQHSVSYFFLPLLKHLKRNSLKIFCYSNLKKEDEVSAKIKKFSDEWYCIWNVRDDVVGQKIVTDDIDILVDLAGHTVLNRLLVFARKPAPIQISWLGYPNTTGLETIDYRLTDSIADPKKDEDQYYSETLIRLDGSFLCYSPPDVVQNELIDKNKKYFDNRRIVFGSFNKLDKLNESVVSTWAEILKGIPDSSLILKNKHLISESIQNNYLTMFADYGVSRERLIMRSRTKSLLEHLTMYNEIDIALDTFPYNGTTTSCEALWMGTPVISLQGNSHVARVGSAILNHLGIADDLTAENRNDYIFKAVSLAKNRSLLFKMHDSLRSLMKKSILCDADYFAKTMEKTFRDLWVKWCLNKNYGKR